MKNNFFLSRIIIFTIFNFSLFLKTVGKNKLNRTSSEESITSRKSLRNKYKIPKPDDTYDENEMEPDHPFGYDSEKYRKIPVPRPLKKAPKRPTELAEEDAEYAESPKLLEEQKQKSFPRIPKKRPRGSIVRNPLPYEKILNELIEEANRKEDIQTKPIKQNKIIRAPNYRRHLKNLMQESDRAAKTSTTSNDNRISSLLELMDGQ